MANTEKVKSFKQDCFHCGDACLSVIQAATKRFCCKGCKQVYFLLHENNLCNYYNPYNNPGIKAKEKFTSGRFDYLDDAAALERRVQFLSDAQLPLVSSSDFSKFAGSFLYSIGRIITYSILVLLFGLTGKGVCRIWLTTVAIYHNRYYYFIDIGYPPKSRFKYSYK